MEIGGLMAQAFKVFLGNPDIMAALITFAIISTLSLSVLEIYKATKL